jgi:hypothetical protein
MNTLNNYLTQLNTWLATIPIAELAKNISLITMELLTWGLLIFLTILCIVLIGFACFPSYYSTKIFIILSVEAIEYFFTKNK